MPIALPQLYAHLKCLTEDPPDRCATCRSDREWRRSLVSFYGGPVDFDCEPRGLPLAGDVTDEVLPDPPTVPPPAPHRPAIPLTPEELAEVERRAAEARKESWLAAARRIAHGTAGLTKYAFGIDRSPDELIADRLAICEACEKSVPKDKPVADRFCDRGGDGSPGCGCWLKAKTALGGERCPLKKW